MQRLDVNGVDLGERGGKIGVFQRESGARKSDRGGRQVNRTTPVIQKHKTIFDSEQGENEYGIREKIKSKLTHLVQDYFTVPEENIKGIESVLTIVDGKIVYGAGEFQNLDPAPLPVLPEWSPIKAYGGYGAPLDMSKAARTGIPVARHHHSGERHLHGCLHAAHQQQVGIKSGTPRYSDLWGLGCDCFAF